MRLLPVRKKDLPGITRLLEQNQETLGFPRLSLDKKLASSSFMLLKLLEKNCAAGFVEVEVAEYEARINCFVIRRGFRGNGFGRKALGLLLCFLEGNGFERVHVFVSAKNSAAKKLYEKAGFYFVGLWQGNGIEVEELEKEFCNSDTSSVL